MPAQSFEGAHRDRVCVCIHRGECMCVYMSACVCTDVQKRNYCANQHVVGWLEGLWYPHPTRVQILVLAFIPGFISGFPAMHIQWEETFLPAQSFGGAHRGRVCVCAFIGVSVCACI